MLYMPSSDTDTSSILCWIQWEIYKRWSSHWFWCVYFLIKDVNFWVHFEEQPTSIHCLIRIKMDTWKWLISLKTFYFDHWTSSMDPSFLLCNNIFHYVEGTLFPADQFTVVEEVYTVAQKGHVHYPIQYFPSLISTFLITNFQIGYLLFLILSFLIINFQFGYFLFPISNFLVL